MSGKPNTKWMQTMINKHGSREAVIEIQKLIASKGGKNGNTGGFASDLVGKDGLTGRQRAAVKGAIGGERSRRKSKKIIIIQKSVALGCCTDSNNRIPL